MSDNTNMRLKDMLIEHISGNGKSITQLPETSSTNTLYRGVSINHLYKVGDIIKISEIGNHFTYSDAIALDFARGADGKEDVIFEIDDTLNGVDIQELFFKIYNTDDDEMHSYKPMVEYEQEFYILKDYEFEIIDEEFTLGLFPLTIYRLRVIDNENRK